VSVIRIYTSNGVDDSAFNENLISPDVLISEEAEHVPCQDEVEDNNLLLKQVSVAIFDMAVLVVKFKLFNDEIIELLGVAVAILIEVGIKSFKKKSTAPYDASLAVLYFLSISEISVPFPEKYKTMPIINEEMSIIINTSTIATPFFPIFALS
jgi:hypothetical protein